MKAEWGWWQTSFRRTTAVVLDGVSRRRLTTAPTTLGLSDHSADRPYFPVVGVGASAGGLEVVTELVRALPPAPGMAFVLVQRLDPHHPSLFSQILGREAKLPIAEAADGLA